jgi:hypothetical protein
MLSPRTLPTWAPESYFASLRSLAAPTADATARGGGRGQIARSGATVHVRSAAAPASSARAEHAPPDAQASAAPSREADGGEARAPLPRAATTGQLASLRTMSRHYV